MAIADFGGSALGQPIEFLDGGPLRTSPSIGASKFREWAPDTKGLTMLLGGYQHRREPCSGRRSPRKGRVRFFAVGGFGASLSGEDCNAYMIHYGYDTTCVAGQRHGQDDRRPGRQDLWFFTTADYASSWHDNQVQQAATKVVEAGGGKVVGSVRAPLSTSDFSSYLLQAQGSGAQVVGSWPTRVPGFHHAQSRA